MALLRYTLDNETKLINTDLVKNITIQKRKELKGDEYIFFYELLFDDIAVKRYYYKNFIDALNEIKKYPNEEYENFFTTIIDCLNKWYPSNFSKIYINNFKKYGWIKIKEFFDGVTFKETMINENDTLISYQTYDGHQVEKIFWLYYFVYNSKYIIKL
ncbi:hypothetical protein [Clostridium thermobutyricum]|uniref:hypothetical protein n=1 Tax=Clostridium thermobutyricum TaxID=29372 RepID=UPI0018AA8213|nr:hypothetical protein [Clostridium thermobutyricum]